MNRRLAGIALLTAASLIWGAAFVAQSLGMQHVGPFTFNASRFLLGGLSLLFPLVFLKSLRRKRQTPEAPRDPTTTGYRTLAQGGLLCGLTLFGSASFQQAGMVYTSAGKAGFITTLYIIIVPLLGLFSGKRVPLFLWGCISAATAGAYLLCVQESFALNRGDGYILICAIFAAGHIILVDRFASRVDGVTLSCLQFFVCGLLSTAAALLVEPLVPDAVMRAWKPIVYTGVVSSAGAYTFQILGQQRVKPVPAALILSLEAVFAALAGWLILGEHFSGREQAGAALLFAAIVAAQLPQRQK